MSGENLKTVRSETVIPNAEDLLADYIAIDSSHPEGDTDQAAAFLADLLTRGGVESTIVKATPTKHNVFAMISGRSNSPVILTHHTDVVPGTPDQFQRDIRDGFVWGRGAIDDKGLGVIHLLTFLRYAREVAQGRTLSRPLVFLGVCDEEIAGPHGARLMIKKLFERAGLLGLSGDDLEFPPIVFDEAGFLMSDIIRKPMGNISVTEKSQIVLKIMFFGLQGHGSVPPQSESDDARCKANKAETALKEAMRPARISEILLGGGPRLPRLNTVSRRAMEKVREIEKKTFISLNPFIRLAASRNEKLFALNHDTIAATLQESDAQINVIPSFVAQYYDIRILPDTDPDEMIKFVYGVLCKKAGLGDEDFSIQAVRKPLPDAPITDPDSEVMQDITFVLQNHFPDFVISPGQCPGFTDARWFRAIGCDAYGILPVSLSIDELSNIHGTEERMSIDGLNKGVDVMYDIVDRMV